MSKFKTLFINLINELRQKEIEQAINKPLSEWYAKGKPNKQNKPLKNAI